jgi:hypothetical protein
MAETTPGIPDPGTLAVDTKRNRVGVVMGNVGPCVQLRPEGVINGAQPLLLNVLSE